MLSAHSVVVRAAGVAARELDDTAVILSLRDGVYYTVDAVALDVWRLIEHDAEVAAIVSELSAKYDASAEEIERDVIEFLEHLIQKDLASVVR